MALLIGTTLAPQLLHAAAWDTMRIWTYSAAMAWLAAWVLTRAHGAQGEISTGVCGLALAALLVNVMATTFLLDNASDHYSLTTRMVLFAPVLVAALMLFLRHDGSHAGAESRSS
jgi:O-antigen/teichoic acid export membrane protein